MNVHSGHLKDDLLFDCYLAARTGETLDPRAADHLADCEECVARYDDVVAFMDATRHDAEQETDELFPAERLRTQRQQILRRIEHVHRPARVITFPNREAAASSRAGVHLTFRWLAAAAAAGLFIGVAVGGYFAPDRLHQGPRAQVVSTIPPMSVQQRPAPGGAVLAGSTQSETPDDDAFLVELEVALARPHTRELQPFDAMTPHVRDIENVGR